MARSTPTAQANRQSRISRTPALAGAGIGSIGSLAASLADAPWGVVLTVALAGLLVALLPSTIAGTIPTASGRPSDVRLLAWLTAVTGLVSVIAVVILALTGHSEAALAVGVIGGAAGAAGGIRVTVNIRG
ncbi:hypothetical protein [Streptomyces sp. NPDC046832]|uniref:hypothetical protein n=1 Tax=Streptomyces sp. NPDC046832 TaxID=3155020 RepID=UPI0033D2BE06